MTAYRIQPHHRLQEWIAEEKGYFTEAGLDYTFVPDPLVEGAKQTSSIRSADSVPVEIRSGAFEGLPQRACEVSAACHWAVNAAAASGVGRMWGNAYTVTPAGVFVPPDSPYTSPEDLVDVPVAVGFHSGSHYATVQALEPFVDLQRIKLQFLGIPNDRIRLLLRGETPAASLFGPQCYVAEQLGYRKLVDATFMVGFLVDDGADTAETEKYFAALRRAQRDLDLRADEYLHYWSRALPSDLLSLVDIRRFGPGERIVFEQYTKEMYEQTQAWIDRHEILDLDGATSSYREAVLA